MNHYRIAVVGSGIAGMTAAYYLSKHYTVDLIEAGAYIGGHTHTVTVTEPSGTPVPIDTGFIVFNDKNYPNFRRLMGELGVEEASSDMSFSYVDGTINKGWGSDFPGGLFAYKSNILSPGFYRMIAGIHRFNKLCLALDLDSEDASVSLETFLSANNVSDRVIQDYVLPMTGAIWSVSFSEAGKFPIRSFIRFWKNHHLLGFGVGLKWKTIQGGAQTYIDKLLPKISGEALKNAPVKAVSVQDKKAVVEWESKKTSYDAVVLATHADTSLSLLTHPTHDQRRLLSPWSYSTNAAFLHSDTELMPSKRGAWSSWNVRKPNSADGHEAVSVTYWMNRLQPLDTDTPYFVSLNPDQIPAPEKTHMQTMYTHPIMNKASMDTQAELPSLNRVGPLFFCGAYFGYGFHEDGVKAGRSAVEGVRSFLG